MFIIPSKYLSGYSLIFECVESIINFHPDELILIVDSYSEDDSYLIDLSKYKNVIISKHKNKHYECGALYYAYDEFPDKNYYILIQDSIILKRDWNPFLYDDVTYNLMYFREMGVFQEREYNHLKKVFTKTKYNHHENNGHLGVFSNSGIYKKHTIENFHKKGLLEAMLPIDKFGSQMTERILGICLTQDGNDLIKNTVEGDFLAKFNMVNNDQLTYFKKTFIGRE